MPNTMLYANDGGQYKPLHSASNKPVFAMPEETLFLEFIHYNSEEHPSAAWMGGNCYNMDEDLLPYPNSTPESPTWVRTAFRPSGGNSSAFQDIVFTRTQVNLKSGKYDGLPASNAGTFRYEIVMWSYVRDGYPPPHSENVYVTAFIGQYLGTGDPIRSSVESNTKHIVSIPTFTYPYGPPFPTPQCHVATVYWNPETRSLSIS